MGLLEALAPIQAGVALATLCLALNLWRYRKIKNQVSDDVAWANSRDWVEPR